MATQDLKKALGLPLSVDGFADGVNRVFYSVKMSEIEEFFELIYAVRHFTKLAISFLYPDGRENLTKFFAFVFKDNPIEDLDQAITIHNYEKIMRQCFDCSGLDFPEEDANKNPNPPKEV